MDLGWVPLNKRPSTSEAAQFTLTSTWNDIPVHAMSMEVSGARHAYALLEELLHTDAEGYRCLRARVVQEIRDIRKFNDSAAVLARQLEQLPPHVASKWQTPSKDRPFFMVDATTSSPAPDEVNTSDEEMTCIAQYDLPLEMKCLSCSVCFPRVRLTPLGTSR